MITNALSCALDYYINKWIISILNSQFILKYFNVCNTKQALSNNRFLSKHANVLI